MVASGSEPSIVSGAIFLDYDTALFKEGFPMLKDLDK